MFKKRFQVKNVAEALTVGDCLRQRREEAGLPLKEVSARLGIKHEYLQQLENGDYRNLPPHVYVRGFIKSYAGFLGVDGGQLIKIYNREVSFISEDENKGTVKEKNRIDFRQYLTVTPKILTFVTSLFVTSVLGYYFVHQLNSFNSKPYLFIENPDTDEVVLDKELWLDGKTEDDATLQINGQDVSVGNDGKFSQKITLSEGRNLLVIEARNRFNRTEKREINIVYEKPNGPQITVEETGSESTPQQNIQVEEITDEVVKNNSTGNQGGDDGTVAHASTVNDGSNGTGMPGASDADQMINQ